MLKILMINQWIVDHPNFFNWMTFIGVIATCIATLISIIQAQKAQKSSNSSEQSALISKSHADNIKLELKKVIDRRQLDRDAQKLKDIKSTLSEKYTKNYNKRGSKLDKDLASLNHVLNEISGQVIFVPYEKVIENIQSEIQIFDINNDSKIIEYGIQSIVSQINEILKSIDGVIKDGD